MRGDSDISLAEDRRWHAAAILVPVALSKPRDVCTSEVVYLADNMLKCVKDTIVLSGLDPAALVGDWEFYKSGMRTWVQSGHLEKVILEMFDPANDALIVRRDIEVS